MFIKKKWNPETKKGYAAHRLTFLLFNGYEPDRHRLVMHTCDNKICINPRHLKEASYRDNTRDYMEKNRKYVSEYRSRFSVDEVRYIAQLLIQGKTTGTVAKVMDAPASTISNIKTGFNWRWLTSASPDRSLGPRRN